MTNLVPGDQGNGVLDRLIQATNAHDIDAIVACFASDYRNETPAHPTRSFIGRDQVRRNWEQILGFVPDIHAKVLRSSVDDGVVWSEWEQQRDAARRHAPRHARRDYLRRRVRRNRLGALLSGASPERGRRRGPRSASSGRAASGMILVAGGSGRLGSLLVRRLVAGGATVRVLRRTRARAAHLDAALVEIVEGDVRVASDAQRAVAGANVVVSAVHGFAGAGGVSPASVDRDGNRHLVDAAARAGATVILMSVVGASAESPMELFRMKDAAEQYLRASGTQWTIVRSTAFLETWIDLIADYSGSCRPRRGVRPGPEPD